MELLEVTPENDTLQNELLVKLIIKQLLLPAQEANSERWGSAALVNKHFQNVASLPTIRNKAYRILWEKRLEMSFMPFTEFGCKCSRYGEEECPLKLVIHRTLQTRNGIAFEGYDAETEELLYHATPHNTYPQILVQDCQAISEDHCKSRRLSRSNLSDICKFPEHVVDK